jgi:hypothetical protein
MKALAREKLISYRNHSVAILDWEKLQTAGQFDASYLQWSDKSFALSPKLNTL